MNTTILLTLICALLMLKVDCEHFVIGNVANRVILANRTRFQYNAIPFMKRVKMFFYNSLDNRKISGIQALDNLHSKASINLTAGGIGHSFVNLRLKSERGWGLDYDIGIYVAQDIY